MLYLLSGDYFSAYHAAKYCGLRSIYFNGVKEKRKKGIRFSLTTAGKKTLSGKIHSWMKISILMQFLTVV